MKSLRNLLREDAAAGSTVAGDVAGVRSPVFTKPMRREVPQVSVPRKKNRTKRLRESLLRQMLAETDKETFKSLDVISKLKSAEKKFNYDRDSVVFGVEDESGNTVKVYVRSDQATQFENTLAEILEDPETENKEISEILFELKSKFEIGHVEWGNIEEDEEEITPPAGSDDQSGEPDDMGDLDGNPEDGSLEFADDGGEMAEPESMDNVESALDKVINMMKADADARKAEAQAKEAEFKAKEAEFAAKAADVKMKGEEEVLDMETYFKAKEDEKKESKKLAKLAQYRHAQAADAEEDLTDSETESEPESDLDGVKI